MPKSIDNKESTNNVGRSAVLLGWEVKRPKYNVDEATGKKTNSGTRLTVRGSSILYYPSKLVNWYDIPTYEPTGTTGEISIVDVRGTTKSRYDSIDDASVGTVSIGEFQRLGGNKKSRRTGRSVQLPVGEGRITPKGNPRLVSFLFPNFFNLIMISQALGQMMANTAATKKPAYFLSESGVTYPIYYTQKINTDGVIPGCNSGAWLTNTLVTAANIDNPDDIPSNANVISAAGDRDGKG